jgi:hypothetical protein
MRVSVQQEKKQRSNEKFKTAKKSLIKMPWKERTNKKQKQNKNKKKVRVRRPNDHRVY